MLHRQALATRRAEEMAAAAAEQRRRLIRLVRMNKLDHLAYAESEGYAARCPDHPAVGFSLHCVGHCCHHTPRPDLRSVCVAVLHTIQGGVDLFEARFGGSLALAPSAMRSKQWRAALCAVRAS